MNKSNYPNFDLLHSSVRQKPTTQHNASWKIPMRRRITLRVKFRYDAATYNLHYDDALPLRARPHLRFAASES